MNNAMALNVDNHVPFTRLESTCGVPARKSGLFGIILEIVTLVISLFLIAGLFMHIGGYNQIFPGSTNSAKEKTVNETISRELTEIDKILNATTPDQLEASIDFGLNEDNNSTIPLNHSNTSMSKAIYHGPFEQINDIILDVGNLEIDILSTLRGTSIFYFIMCLFWLISIIVALISLKFEILDFAFINTFTLAAVTIFQFLKSLLIGILIFYERYLRWRSLIAISVTVGGLLLCFAINLVAFIYLIIWIRYVDYMKRSDDSCLLTSKLNVCVKRHSSKRREDQNVHSAPSDYSIPEATRHSNLPYIDEQPIQQFSNF